MSPKLAGWLFVLLTAVGTLRIVSTYRTISQTVDETPNIACGMQWLDQGRYDMGPFHPPLARIAIAIGPYLYGLRSTGLEDRWKEGNAILHSKGVKGRCRYGAALTAARLGILPFFILACACVWLWSRRLVGEAGGIAALFLFSNTPMVLAHAGLATTDMVVAAGLLFAFYRFARFLDQPDLRRGLLLGLAAAVALLAKFSSFVLLPVSWTAILILYLIRQRRLPAVNWKALAAAAGLAAVLVWGGYRFSIGTMKEPISSGLADQSKFWQAVSRTPVPAPLLWDGLLLVKGLHHDGHVAYLFNEIRDRGWWYFFPVALGVKTPLAILLAALLGLAVAWRGGVWDGAAPALCALIMLLSCLPSQLNTGLRYLLALFPLLAVLGAQGLTLLWRWKAGRYAAGVLVLWLTVASVSAHPDYIPYFNELAGKHPENILVDSDLDWGQDTKRLIEELKRRKVPFVYVSLLYSGDDSKLELPAWDGLPPFQPVEGWVAISYYQLKVRGQIMARDAGKPGNAYGWLEAYQPVSRIGKSILLYYIPKKTSGSTS